MRRRNFVRRVRRRAGIERSRHAVEASHDLRRHVEVGIGGRLADPILEPGGRVAGAAEHADHRAAIVTTPNHAVWRKRIAAVAFIAVDRRGGEGGCRARMGEQTGQKAPPGARKPVVVVRRENVGAGSPVAQRLMQVPAARHHVFELRPGHERGVAALPAADLFHRAAEQHHGVGG